ncbi:exonuclease domain-containing protein [Lysobacter sp. H23M47]|uniref:exonuclease domain-containing protein n=1 Tax=Lysobacter sp. H23M47 TaxID=2781024 RepID=UPI00187F8C09|nr:exonuclease domain-containing protein [Lysobacter sp. H23M47]QOW24493.1 transposase [Lysobacter sp. H23M47]
MDFVVIDVETANPNLASICQVGIAVFSGGCLEESWSSLVNPDDYFDSYNVAVHGIEESQVVNAPRWAEVHDRLSKSYSNQILASHTPFDRTAVQRACQKAGTTPFECRWLDTARVVRRTWPEFSKSGYGLANVASHLGINFKHHDAEEDARAAGEILLRAIQESGSTVDEWCSLSLKSNSLTASTEARDGNPDGPLFGNIVVFTGALSVPRREAANAAAAAGCEVGTGVTKHTTILVVGDQDIRKLAGSDKSSKHKKAETLMAKGQLIRVVGESDFGQLINS